MGGMGGEAALLKSARMRLASSVSFMLRAGVGRGEGWGAMAMTITMMISLMITMTMLLPVAAPNTKVSRFLGSPNKN